MWTFINELKSEKRLKIRSSLREAFTVSYETVNLKQLSTEKLFRNVSVEDYFSKFFVKKFTFHEQRDIKWGLRIYLHGAYDNFV